MFLSCQIAGCKNKSTTIKTKDGIFLGLYLEDIRICTCGKHSDSEVSKALEKIGEAKASTLQHCCNPFVEIQKISNKSA